MKNFLLFVLFLLTNLALQGQNINGFLVTSENGTCASNSKIKVKLPTSMGFPATTDFLVKLQKPNNPNEETQGALQSDTSEVEFSSLENGTFTVTVVRQDTGASAYKTVTLVSSYKPIAFKGNTILQTPPGCTGSGVDGAVSFTIAAGSEGPFRIVLKNKATNQVVYSGTHAKANPSNELAVNIRGTNAMPIRAGEYTLSITDLKPPLGCGGERIEPITIVPTNSSIDCIEFFKSDDGSIIRMDENCKMRFIFRVLRKDLAPMPSAVVNQITSRSGLAVVKRYNSNGVLLETLDITSTYAWSWREEIKQSASFYTPYMFEEDDIMELTINMGTTPIKERIKLSKNIIDVTKNTKTNKENGVDVPWHERFRDGGGDYTVGLGNRSDLRIAGCAAGQRLFMWVGTYYRHMKFTNEADPSDVAGYGAYYWHNFDRWIPDGQTNPASSGAGYYYEVYKWTGPNGFRYDYNLVTSDTNWTLLVPGTDYTWIDHEYADLTNSGEGFYKVKFKAKKAGSTVANYCYEPQRAIYMTMEPNQLDKRLIDLEVNKGVFEGTVSVRKWISAVNFDFPLTVKLDYIDDGKVGTGTRTYSFQTRLPLQQSTYTETITFPIVREVKTPLDPTSKYFEFGDFPAGRSELTVTDACGNSATRMINFDTPTRYNDKLVVDHGCGSSGSIYYKVDEQLGTIRSSYYTLYKWNEARNGWYAVPNSSRYEREYTFTGLEPGKYKIQASGFMYGRVKTASDVGLTNWTNLAPDSQVNGYSILRPNAQPNWSIDPINIGRASYIISEIPITIKPAGTLILERVGTSCTVGAGSGLIAVKVTNAEDIRYPLTFQLYRAGQTSPIQTSPEFDEASAKSEYIFQNLPDGDYFVKAIHNCGGTGNYDVKVVANTYSEPSISHSVASLNPCNGDEVKLTFSGSDTIFNIDWYIESSTGTRTHIGTGKTITQTITENTKFVAVHSLKTAGLCASGVGEKTRTVVFAPDTQAPVITGCPVSTIEVNASVGSCEGVATWGVVTATDNCSVATFTQSHRSGDSFPIGITTVTYSFTDTSGNVATCTFFVKVKSNALILNTKSSYIDGTGNALTQDLSLNQSFQYKISYQNVGQEDVTTSTLVVKLPDNQYVEVGEPTLLDASVGTFMPTYTKLGRTYTFIIPKETLKNHSAERTIYFPMEIVGNYQQIGLPCNNFLKSEYIFEYEGGAGNCAIAKQTKTASNTAVISTVNNERSELFCEGSTLTLTVASGFDTYKWYKDGTLLASVTSNEYHASESGTYRVEKTTTCQGVTVVSHEKIQFKPSASTPDPIKAQANGGATCSGNGAWTSHFILCNEASRVIQVSYANSQLVWQRYKGTRSDECPDYEESNWENDTNGVGNIFTAKAEGRYRLRVSSSNGCQADYYFNVYMNKLSGEVVQPVGHVTDYEQGHFSIRMATEGITYLYTLKNAANQVVNGIENVTGTHLHKFTGITQAGDYYVEVKSPDVSLTCSTVLRTKLERQQQLTAKATGQGWVSCNGYKIRFEAQGGKAPYRFAIFKINDEQLYQTNNYREIPDADFNIATIPSGSAVVDSDVNITQPGTYVFIVRDGTGEAHQTTAPITIYPEGVNGYTIGVKDITCAATPNSGQVSVTFNSTQNISTKLHKLGNSGNIITTYSPNNSGFYDGLSVGKYRLEIIIKKSNTVNCIYTNPITIKQVDNTLKAYAGVVEDISCDVNSPKRYKVKINNVSGGTGTGYTYSSNGVDYQASNELYLSTSGRVYVKDSAGCPLEINVNITPLVPPTVSVSNVIYNCEGKGTFTVTASPSGSYIYELVSGSVSVTQTSNVFTLPKGDYTIYLHYKPDASDSTPNILFKEDFGVGADTCDSSVIYMTCKANQPLVQNQYAITKQVQGNPEWVSPTPLDASATANGRYLAVNASSNSGNMSVLYQKTIKDIVTNGDLKVSLNLHNLLLPSYVGGKNPNIDLVLRTKGGIEKHRIGLGSIPATGNWIEKSVVFPASAVSDPEMILVIQNKENSTVGTDLAIDNITIWQNTKLCDTRIEGTSVEVKEGNEFKISSVIPNDAGCSNGKGSLTVVVENRAGSVIQYSTDNTNWNVMSLSNISANVDSGVIPNLSEVVDGTVYIRKQNDPSCIKEEKYTIRIPEAMVVTSTILRKPTCATLDADVRVTATGGVRPYKQATIGGITVPMVNNVATFEGANTIGVGTYVVAVVDRNDCTVTGTVEIKAPKTLIANVVNLEPCATANNGKVQIEVVDGNGNYQFSKDGGNRFFTPQIVDGTSYIFENLPQGTHNFVVKDDAGCSVALSATVYPALRLQVSDPVQHLTCVAGSKTEYTLTSIGGSAAPKEFLWSMDGINYTTATATGIAITQSGNTATFTTSRQGTYYFQVRYQYSADNYCTAESQSYRVEIIKPSIKNSPIVTNINCGGTNTGKISLSLNDIQGGQAPYDLILFDGTTTTTHSVGTIAGLSAGSYILRVKDSANCLSDARTVEITQSPPLTVTITTERLQCSSSGVTLGSATIKIEDGGVAPFDIVVKYKDVYGAPAVYSATGVSTGVELSITDLMPHDYTYQIVDNQGCITNGVITIEGTTDRLLTRATGIASGCETSSLVIEAYNDGGVTLAAGSYWAAVYRVGQTQMPIRGTFPAGAVSSFNLNGTQWYRGEHATVVNHHSVSVPGMKATIPDLQPGVHYKFIVYDNSTGCYIIEDATITPPALSTLTATISTVSTTCQSSDDGEVSFMATGMDALTTSVDYQVYTYSVGDDVFNARGTAMVTGGVASATITGLPAGKFYILFKENPSDCVIASVPFVIAQSSEELRIDSVSSSNDNCLGGKGNILVEASGGTAPYKLYVHDMVNPLPSSSALLASLQASTIISSHSLRYTNVAQGNYRVYVMDAYGCIKSDDIAVGKDSAPVIASAEVVNPCGEELDYSVRLNLSSVGMGQHRYRVNGGTWQPIAIYEGMISVVLPRKFASSTSLYTIDLIDANTCSSTSTVMIYSPVSYELSATELKCSDSTVTITIENLLGGSGNYTYSVNKIREGVDENGNAVELVTSVVTSAPAPAGNTPITIGGLASLSGVYEVSVFDAAYGVRACAISERIEIIAPVIPVAEVISIDQPTCYGGTGSLRVKVTPANLNPYTFEVVATNSPTITLPIMPTLSGVDYAVFSGLPSSDTGIEYTIKVKSNNNNCDATVTATIQSPSKLDILTGALSNTVYTCQSGNIPTLPVLSFDLTKVIGGTPSYTQVEFYKAGSATPLNTQLIASGTVSYTYQLLQDVSAVTQFYVKVKDANGCEAESERVTVTPTLVLSRVDVTSTVSITCVTMLETVSVALTTGTPYAGEQVVYTVMKRQVDGTETLFETRTSTVQSEAFNLPIGNYIVLITNPLTGCQVQTVYDVRNPDTFAILPTNIKNVVCYGSATGEVTLNFSDTRLVDGNQASAGFEYLITPIIPATATTVSGTVASAMSYNVTGLLSGLYEVKATSIATGCVVTATFEITQSQLPITATAVETYGVTCSNDKGEVLVTVKGGRAPYQVTLSSVGFVVSKSGGDTTNNTGQFLFTGLSSNPISPVSYSVKVVDNAGMGCVMDDITTITLHHPAPITATASVTQHETCPTANNGVITISGATGGSGTPTFNYTLQGVATDITQTSPVFTNLPPGTYTVGITDAWSCDVILGTYTVNPALPMTLTYDSGNLVVCNGQKDAWLNMQISGGKAPYQAEVVNSETGAVVYSLAVPAIDPMVRIPTMLGVGKYEIVITDALACTMSPVYQFEVKEAPNLDAIAQQVHACDAGYKTWIEVRFKDTIDFDYISFQIGTEPKRAFSRSQGNVGYIDANAFTNISGTHTLTIYYDDVDIVTGQNVACSLTLSDPITIEQLLQLDEVIKVTSNRTLNVLEVTGRDGKAPYTYIFNGKDQASDGVYQMKVTDPEEVIDGKRYKIIEVTIYDAVGCVATKTFKELYHDIIIPNFFTPDADGVNDTWTPLNLADYPNVRTHIFDRYGRRVTSLARGEAWDGRYEGKDLPSGDYWYIIDLGSDIDNRKFQGNFNLYR